MFRWRPAGGSSHRVETVTLQLLRPLRTVTRERATGLQRLHHLAPVLGGLDTSSPRQQWRLRSFDLHCVQLQYHTYAIHPCNYGNTMFTYGPLPLLSHTVYSSCWPRKSGFLSSLLHEDVTALQRRGVSL